MLKSTEQIFGIDTNLIVKQGKRYRIGMAIGISVDVVIMVLLILKVLFSAGESVGQAPVYIIVCIAAALFANMVIATSIKDEVKEAYHFYNRFKKCPIEIHHYKLDKNSFFSVLFCTGYSRVKPDMSIESYRECLDAACCQNKKYAKKLMAYLSNYEDDVEGNLEVCVVRKGKSLYYVNTKSFVDNNIKQEEMYDDSDERDA